MVTGSRSLETIPAVPSTNPTPLTPDLHPQPIAHGQPPVDTISDNRARRLQRTAWNRRNRVGMWNRVDGRNRRNLAGVKSRIMVAQIEPVEPGCRVEPNEASFRMEQAKPGCHAEQMEHGYRGKPMDPEHQMEQSEQSRRDGYLDESSFQRNQPFSGQEQRNSHRANRTKKEVLCVGCSNRNQRRNLIEYRRIRTHL